jgi:Growth inhibitor
MVKKWSLYWVNLEPVVGSEQSGIRPVVAISNDMVNEILPIVTILPISSMKKNSRIYPTEVLLKPEVSGLQKPSIVMIHQVRTISKQRIGNKCGEIKDEKIIAEINDTLREYFEV